MISVLTETTELQDVSPTRGWIFYDGDCRSCSNLASRFARVFSRRGFTFEPLQEQWVQQTLGLSEAEALAEMRVLTRNGNATAGADAIIFLARQVWWMAPLSVFAKLPGARASLRRMYQWVAAHRHCTIRDERTSHASAPWLPLLVLPIVAMLAKPFLPAWGFMWAMAFAIFFGCKWLTFALARTQIPDACPFRSAAYLAWPGMDAARFLSWTPAPPLANRDIANAAAQALTRITLGMLLLFVVARLAAEPLLTGWIGMAGIVLLLHFGFFDLVSLGWRKLRVNAPPVMNAPLRSRSVAEFWGRRWNGAFNQLATRFIFRTVAHRTRPATATMCAFGVSGLVHELVISLPANTGYGLPTAYFLTQGAALLLERRFGAHRLFTIAVVAGPAFWLFHPTFVHRVILPFMQTIGAL